MTQTSIQGTPGRYYFLLLTSVVVLFSCKNPEDKLFRLLPPDDTAITFANTINETDSFNIMTEEFIYNGAGVAVGDFDNDGLPDLFFSGNEVSNKLYINQGNLRFLDITESAGVAASDKWSTGVTVVDINQDGLLDIYVCAALKKDSVDRANMLFVNLGLDEQGRPHFEEQAAKYGIDEMGYSMNALFFDYDNDGDLDLYVLNNLLVNYLPGVYRDKITDGTAGNNDRLYRNNGDGTFSNVSHEAGIRIEGYGLGVAIADFNMDGWSDIYVSNDYLSNDVLYINNRDGTFTNRITDYIRHQSYFSMGIDVGDINNDGQFDIVTLDMLAESSFRMKTTISKSVYQNYINNQSWGFEYQYVRNMLHLNNGHGLPFSEIGHFAGISQTDWSWSPLLVDLDNDGYRDLLISNGYPRDVTDKDFTNFRVEMGTIATTKMLLDSIPIVQIPNYVYRNNGDLTFADKGDEWGLGIPSFSNGAVVVDLDMDGDLDYVVNNINQEAFVFENTLNPIDTKDHHFIRLKLKGTSKNPSGIGAKVTVRTNKGKLLYHEHHLSRGYMSTVEDIVHFGLGADDEVAEIQVYWQEGMWQRIGSPEKNKLLTLSITEADERLLETLDFPFTPKKMQAPMEEISTDLDVSYAHPERDYIDYYLQRTLPHKLSQYGPGLAVGDIDGDGLEDLLIGGAAGYPQHLLSQQRDGSFTSREVGDRDASVPEDMGLLLADFDNDGDLDLYAVSGSNEYAIGASVYQDRLFLNNGNGEFEADTTALPYHPHSGTVVRGADFNGDGWLDVFVGGRSDQGQYPLPGKSRILLNAGGKFSDVTADIAPDLSDIGMVTDALWTDYNQDGKVDLLVVGEFMEITFFTNMGDRLEKAQDTGLEGMTGWWTGITAGDFDGDGDSDYLVGNWGLNNFYQVTEERPLTLYAKDFDNNQSIDPILFSYQLEEKGSYSPFPVHFWEDIYGQSPMFRKRFQNFKSYARVGLDGLLSEQERDGALVLQANQLASVYIENLGDGTFSWKQLPTLAQLAPVYGMVTLDVDSDGFLDVLLVGNDFGNEVFSGRLDALTGLWLKGDGTGNFEAVGSSHSGFSVLGDGKALVIMDNPSGNPIVVASQNRGELRMFSMPERGLAQEAFEPRQTDMSAMINYKDGRVRKVEFYLGSGFLSQSTRTLYLNSDVESLEIRDFEGNLRKLSGPSFE
nr:hypothetical protein [Cytophagales bacterium]